MARVWILGSIIAGLAANTACVSRQLAPPPEPAPTTQRADLSHVSLSLREFTLVGHSEDDTPVDIERLQDRFLDYVENAAAFGDVTYNLSGRLPARAPALELTVKVDLVEDTKRTYVLDAVNVPFLGLWPIVPAWGEAQVNVVTTLAAPGAPGVVELREQVAAPYSAVFFAWYRRAPIEEAFARATAEAFARIAAAIPSAVATIDANNSAPPPVAMNDGANESAAPVGMTPIVDWPTRLPSQGVRIIDSQPPAEGVLAAVLGTLGGVEFAGFKGLVRVSSTAFLESGEEAEVASGTAVQTGYRIGLYSAPKVTGLFVYPALGYVNQKIDNVDTRSELFRLNQMLAPDPRDIGAIASDPDTGGAVDAGAENVYHLELQSGYAGVRAGVNLVVGTPSVEFFGSFSLGLNVVEYRTIRSVLDKGDPAAPPSASRTKHRGWDFIRSGAVGATVGLRLPKLHSAVRFIFDYEIYRDFEYERPLDVRGPATYDVDNQIFQHEMLSMRGASLSSVSFQLALAVVY
jgi:hypothetical protein